MRKGKDIIRNRANYFSLFFNYNGGWGAIKFDDRIDDAPDFIVISPMWGMRRTLANISITSWAPVLVMLILLNLNILIIPTDPMKAFW